LTLVVLIHRFRNNLQGTYHGNWSKDVLSLMGMVLHTVDIGAQARKTELAMK
jgi:hypothetical protein